MSQEQVAELREEVAAMKRDIANLQGWQKTQNRTLQRIDDRLHSLERWIMAILATSLISVLLSVRR